MDICRIDFYSPAEGHIGEREIEMRTITSFWNEFVKPEYKVRRGTSQWKAVVEEKNSCFADGRDYEISGHYTKTGNSVMYMQL